MKYQKPLSLLFACLTLVGCKVSHEHVVDLSKVVKYKSRCDSVSNKQSNQHLPLVAIEPVYPKVAEQRKARGYVIMEFNVSDMGKPIDINIIESYPYDLFVGASKTALLKWVYKPKATQCNVVRLDYEF